MIARQLTLSAVKQAREALEMVFESLDPFDKPFKAGASQRAILYPAEGYELGAEAWSALSAATRAVGESSAYYATVEGQEARELESVWAVRLSAQARTWFEASATDGTRNPIAESAIWSTQGTWGLLISHEQHVVVGGTDEFMARLVANVPDAAAQARTFIADVTHFAGGVDRRPPWLTALLTHIYGDARAHELLRAGADGDARR